MASKFSIKLLTIASPDMRAICTRRLPCLWQVAFLRLVQCSVSKVLRSSKSSFCWPATPEHRTINFAGSLH